VSHLDAVTPDTCAVLLAAGGGSRFAGTTHKLLAELQGVAVWRRSVQSVIDAGFDSVIVVTGAVQLPVSAHDRARLQLVHNPRWAHGQSTSLRAGVDAAARGGARRVVVGLADQPFIAADSWRRIAHADTTNPIVVATYDGVRGPNPVRLASQVWPLLPNEGDVGARDVIRAHPQWVTEIECVGSTADIDTLEDLERWTSY
jgi:CTP:molybdopterin cytidylyltransferase MocA